MEKHPTLAAVCWMATAILTGFMVLTQLGVMLSLLAGRAGLAAVAPAGVILALFGGDWLGRRMGLARRWRFRAAGLALGGLAGAIAFSAFYFDLSWDGQWYHQTAIYAIAQDWNPLTEPMREFIPSLQLWVRHYAKGPWYVAAAIYETTGHAEWGKAPAVLAWIATGLAVFAAGLDWGLRRRHAAAVALLVALNPVAMSELTTYLVDGIMIGFLGVVMAAMTSAFRRPHPALAWIGGAATIATINAKFTGLVFLCFVFAAGGLWCLLRRRAWVLPFAGWTALALVLGTLVWGYNPYVTNTVHRHQPFYPVLGSAAFPSLTQQGKEGIERLETPKNFLSHGRLYRLAYATFGRPGNAPYRNERNAQLMWPFAARAADLFYYRYHETRVAGFGPWFSGALLLTFGLGVWLLFQPTPARGFAVLAVATIVASLLISLHLWWPRYGPQLWLLPIVPIACVFWSTRSRWALGVTWLLVALLLMNAGLVAGVRLAWETRASLKLRRQLTELRAPGTEIEICLRYFERPVEERLKAWGIRFQKRSRTELPTGTELVSVVEGYPGAVLFRVLPNRPTSPPR